MCKFFSLPLVVNIILFRRSPSFSSQQKVILNAFSLSIFHLSIHPYILTTSSSLSTRILRSSFVIKFSVSSSYSSISIATQSILVFYLFIHPYYCSLGREPEIRVCCHAYAGKPFYSAFVWVCYDLPEIRCWYADLHSNTPLRT